VASFAFELRACIGEIAELHVPPVAGGIEPERFFRQWLAERNLGLVPIQDAASFEWAGRWIALVRGGERLHAVVMFGSPSGVWLDPGGAYGEGVEIEAGLIVTPLDLHLSTRSPWGTSAGVGVVAGILVAPRAEATLVRVETVAASPGGLDGDRYARGVGTFSGPGLGYELTLVEAEVLGEIDLSWEDARRNIVTTGISLNALVGQRFRVGPVTCVGRRLAEPCAHLERLARRRLLRPLVHRGGLRADILTDGRITLGDTVAATDRAASPHDP
jgi:hypothetical protein